MQKNGSEGGWNLMKITCDIINDLLPSYVDGVCSEDSCKLVEEHLHDCARCSQKLTYMKNPIKCPEIQPTEKIRNPFIKIKRTNRIKLIAAVMITICVVSGGMFAIQEVGTLHDYFYPSNLAVIDNKTDRNEWSQINIADENFLNFNSIFYNKEVVNDANSSGDVMLRILDENKNIVLDEIIVEPGTSIDLDMLQNNRNYIVEVKCKTGRFFLNFV